MELVNMTLPAGTLGKEEYNILSCKPTDDPSVSICLLGTTGRKSGYSYSLWNAERLESQKATSWWPYKGEDYKDLEQQLLRKFLENAKLGSDKELVDANRVVELDPNNAEVYLTRGRVYLQLGKYAEAISDYSRAIELNPNDAGAYRVRGNLYDLLGQCDAAISDLSRVIELDPGSVDNYTSRGRLYGISGQYNAAISDLSLAIEFDPDYAVAYALRGDVYRSANQWNLARADYEKALQLNPAHEEAQAGLAALMAFLK